MNRRDFIISGVLLILLLNTLAVFGQKPAQPPSRGKWSEPASAIWYLSKADNTFQPAIWYAPKTTEPVPLIVALHTWSGDYTQLNQFFLNYAVRNNWAMIYPHFRGPNWTPAGCGSDLVVEDVVSAVEYAQKNTKIDSSRIYLMGSSGGGYLSMLMVGRHPEIWAGVCSWVGISNLADWYKETKSQNLQYYKHLEQACGGAPGSSPEVDEQYRYRSAITWVAAGKNVPFSINHGIHDGHRGHSVPVSQSIRCFNKLVPDAQKVTEEQIAYIVEKEAIPDVLKKEATPDPAYGTSFVHFRRTVGNTRLTIFEAGHGAVPLAGLNWLAQQRKGQPAQWTPTASKTSSAGTTTDVQK